MTEFMIYYKEEFLLALVTPKMHILEDHIVPWMQRWYFCPGFHTEQGAESIHAIFNSLGHTYTSVQNPQEQLKLIFQLQVGPSTDAARPLNKEA